jgi:hypothetical protein
MKRQRFMGILVGLVVNGLSAQNQYLWIKLADDRVVINAAFQELTEETIVVKTGMKKVEFSLSEVDRIRVVRQSEILEGALYGSAIGFGAGAAIGLAAQSNGTDKQNPLSTALIFTVIGGVVGTVKSAFEKPEPIIDLEGKNVAEKRRTIESLLLKKQE